MPLKRTQWHNYRSPHFPNVLTPHSTNSIPFIRSFFSCLHLQSSAKLIRIQWKVRSPIWTLSVRYFPYKIFVPFFQFCDICMLQSMLLLLHVLRDTHSHVCVILDRIFSLICSNSNAIFTVGSVFYCLSGQTTELFYCILYCCTRFIYSYRKCVCACGWVISCDQPK